METAVSELKRGLFTRPVMSLLLNMNRGMYQSYYRRKGPPPRTAMERAQGTEAMGLEV